MKEPAGPVDPEDGMRMITIVLGEGDIPEVYLNNVSLWEVTPILMAVAEEAQNSLPDAQFLRPDLEGAFTIDEDDQ